MRFSVLEQDKSEMYVLYKRYTSADVEKYK